MFFKKLIEISKEDFYSKDKLSYIRKKVTNGNIVIIRNHFKSKGLRELLLKLKKKPNFVKNTKMIEGIGNICYRSVQKGLGKYSTNDISWYFFPWNKDETGLLKKVKKTFFQITKLNEYDPKKIYFNTPKDRFVMRAHLMFYPYKEGHISLHCDPVNVTKITCGVYVTCKKQDYDKGGFYVLNNKKEKIFIDHKINSGDIILFYNGLYHGVEPTYLLDTKKNKDKINGRAFLNLSILESQEYKDRQYTRGINLSVINKN